MLYLVDVLRIKLKMEVLKEKKMKKTFLLLLLFFVTNILIAQETEEANHRSWQRNNTTSKKLDLVIGNSKYQFGGILKEPAKDADVIASALKEQGYDILIGYNLDLDEMNNAIFGFSDKLSNYNEAVIYYAGHGFQVDGKNYIAPTSANPRMS